jgi:hypothetical protein
MVGRLLACVVLVVCACGDDDGPSGLRDAGGDAASDATAACVGPAAPPSCTATAAPTTPATSSAQCNPLTQTGCAASEKCTWITDQTTPQRIGHIGCTPTGTVETGCACTTGLPGSTGYDDCQKGSICQQGVCKQICDNQGGSPQCDASFACVTYAGLFSTGGGPAAAGACTRTCDPLADNDFLGSGSRPGCLCGSGDGCYGFPSFGTWPVTAFTCTPEINSSLTLVHRSRCDSTTGCAPNGTFFINSCSQGYLPLLREESGITTVICVALCKPLTCYAGNCGTDNADRLGAAPHRCTTADRRGSFDTSLAGEHCAHLWMFELTDSGPLLPSAHSDSLGFCYDHSKYRYDSNNDGQITTADQTLPPCAVLQAGYGSGSDPSQPQSYFGAADLGCVPSSSLPAAAPPADSSRRPLDVRLPRAISAGGPLAR